MNDPYHLNRFFKAQEEDYALALSEIKNGRKESHWMWYIFPQLADLGYSSTAKYYGIQDLEEAKAYLQHPLLRSHLLEICEALRKCKPPVSCIFPSPDHLKLRSSMTLFLEADPRSVL